MANPEARVWLVRAGREGEDEAFAFERDVILIGFHDVGDLTTATTEAIVYAAVRAASPGDREQRARNRGGQLVSFRLRMNVGDLVVLPSKRSPTVAIGRITGGYAFLDVDGVKRHARPVQWLRLAVPRTAFRQDLLYSLGAFMTVCQIQRNEAERRIATVAGGGDDPGFEGAPVVPPAGAGVLPPVTTELEEALDLADLAHQRVVERIQRQFAGHDLSRLVESVLIADGWTTRNSPPGPDGGVDILAGRGTLGLDSPTLCVQVKSQTTPCDVNVLRALQGTMRTFGAQQGLLVCWGGFTRPTLTEARQTFFTVRLWDSRDLVESIYRTYSRLPEEIQAELPMKQIWTLVEEE